MKKNKIPVTAHGIGIAIGAILLIWGFSEALNIAKIIGIAVMGYNIYRLVRIKKQAPAEDDPLYTEQDEAHTVEIQKIQSSIRISNIAFVILAVVACVMWIIGFINGGYVSAIIVSVIACIVKLVSENYKTKQKAYVSENIVKQAMEAVFENAQYSSNGHIAEDTVIKSGFISGYFDAPAGVNYVSGTYNGVQVQMCDLILEKSEIRTDKNGYDQRETFPVFRGLWLVADSGRELPCDVTVRERGNLGKLVSGKDGLTENEEFNKRFAVEAEDEFKASRMLTSRVTDAIMVMDAEIKGATFVKLGRDGVIQIAIDKGCPSFAAGKHNTDATSLRRSFTEEIQSMAAVIDAIKAVNII